MANIAGFKFFDFSSVDSVSSILSNPNIGEAITIEVEDGGGEINITVQGRTDIEGTDNWHNIAVIGLEDYSVASAIKKAGLYVVPFEGIQQCRMISNGAVGGFKVYSIATGHK